MPSNIPQTEEELIERIQTEYANGVEYIAKYPKERERVKERMPEFCQILTAYFHDPKNQAEYDEQGRDTRIQEMTVETIKAAFEALSDDEQSEWLES